MSEMDISQLLQNQKYIPPSKLRAKYFNKKL